MSETTTERDWDASATIINPCPHHAHIIGLAIIAGPVRRPNDSDS
jgi:hypothetical protein